jgi:hypothetical protein
MKPTFDVPSRYRADLGDALVAYAATHPAAAGREAAARRSGRWARRLPLTAAAVVAIAAIAMLLVDGAGGGGSPQTASAATVLRTAAIALDRHGLGTPLRHGEFDYTKLLTRMRLTIYSRTPYVVTAMERRWVATNGAGRDDYDVLSVERVTPTGERPLRNRSLPGAVSTDGRMPAQARPFPLATVADGISFSYAQIRALPTDPRRLAARIDAIAAKISTRLVGDLRVPAAQLRAAATLEVIRSLAEAPTPPALMATLYRVLAQTPGVHLLGQVKDAAGRVGTEIDVQVGSIRQSIIVDTATGALLETRRAIIYRSTQFPGSPGLIDEATVLARGVVRSDKG